MSVQPDTRNVIEIDSDLLRGVADAAAHAKEQSAIHFETEYKGFSQELVDTLTPEGPYAYTILAEVTPDGSVHLPILTTREDITEAYKSVRGASDLHAVDPITEIRGTWYTFVDSISRATNKSSGEYHEFQMLGLLPSGKGKGITGELLWVRVPRSALGGGDLGEISEQNEMHAREEVLKQYDRYLRALEVGDLEGVLATLHERGASAVRDYVNDTGTLTSLEGSDAHRAYYEALLSRYNILSADPLYRVTEDWYIFSETRFCVAPRETGRSEGKAWAFNTAEFFMPANDGRFIARIGHGTDRVPLD